MRELLIDEYKKTLDYMNNYWKGWRDKQHKIKEYPDFQKWDDKELLEQFKKLYGSACQPRM